MNLIPYVRIETKRSTACPRRLVHFYIVICNWNLGNHSAGKSSFINWYIEEHVQRTGVAIGKPFLKLLSMLSYTIELNSSRPWNWRIFLNTKNWEIHQKKSALLFNTIYIRTTVCSLILVFSPETQGFNFVTSGRRRESLTGNATLHLYPHFKPLQVPSFNLF